MSLTSHMNGICSTITRSGICCEGRYPSRKTLSLLFVFFLLETHRAWAVTATSTALAITANGLPVTTVPAETAVTLTATVTAGANAARPGTVNFCDATAKYCTDIHLIGTAQVTNSGTATYKFRPGPGSHSYKAVFLGTNNYTTSVSTPSSLTVPGGGVMFMSATGSPGNYTLNIAIPGTATTVPSGNVSIVDTTNGNYSLGNPKLVPDPTGPGFIGTNPPTGIEPDCIVWGDFNGDGIPDLVISDYGFGPATLTVLMGNGDGTFRQGVRISIAPYSVDAINNLAVGDFNNDGELDIAVATEDGYPGGGPISIFLGNGDGTFNLLFSALDGIDARGITVSDFNHDGNLDLALTNSPGSVPGFVTVLLGNGDGTFTAVRAQAPIGVGPVVITSGDFNGDGKTDLAVGTGTQGIDILLGNGDGTFTTAPNITSSVFNEDIVTADINRDGVLDLALANYAVYGGIYSVEVYLGNGDGTFTQSAAIQTVGPTVALAVGDLNADGIPDLAVPITTTSSGNPGGSVDILLGNGDGTFTLAATTPATDLGPEAIVVTDLNGDGAPDIAVANETANDVSVLLTITGTGSTATLTGVSVVGTGTHYAEATYPGDGTFPASVSNLVPLLATLEPTTATLTGTPATAPPGTPVALTATVVPDTAQNHNATGTVTFYYGTAVLGIVPLVNGISTLNVSTLPVGTDQITCIYSGDTNFATSTCNTVPITITTDTLTLTSSANPSPALAPVTFTATLNVNGQPAGAGYAITLSLNGQIVPLTTGANGAATYTISTLSPGSYPVTATFAATSSLAAASASLTEVITPAIATVTLTATPSLVFVGNPVALSASVSSTYATPTGTLTFLDGTTPLGTVALASAATGTSSAAISTSALALGTHSITASYSGDTNFAAAVSAPVTVIVEDFALAIANTPLTIHHGGTAVFNLNLNAVGGPMLASPITLTVSGNPDHAPVTFSPATVPATAASAAATLTIATPDYPVGPWSSVHKPAYFRARNTSLALLALGGLLLPFTRRSRRRLQRLTAVLLFVAASLLLGSASGCGSGWGDQSYHITVTAASGNLSHTATAILITEP